VRFAVDASDQLGIVGTATFCTTEQAGQAGHGWRSSGDFNSRTDPGSSRRHWASQLLGRLLIVAGHQLPGFEA